MANNAYQAEESKSIKQENSDNKVIEDAKRSAGTTSTTHLITAPPLKPCRPADSKKEVRLHITLRRIKVDMLYDVMVCNFYLQQK